jgi:hypothetical protein
MAGKAEEITGPIITDETLSKINLQMATIA